MCPWVSFFFTLGFSFSINNTSTLDQPPPSSTFSDLSIPVSLASQFSGLSLATGALPV